MPQSLGFRGVQQLRKRGPLELHALIEGLEHGRLDRIDALGRRRIILGNRCDGGAGEIEERLGVRKGGRRVACLLQRQLAVEIAFRKCDRRRGRVCLDDQVQQIRRLQLTRRDGIAADDHVQRAFGADEPRQSLCSSGARQQTELHFRQAELRRRRSHPVVADQGELQAAAEGGAVERRNHRLGRLLDLRAQIREVGRGNHLRGAELGHIRARRRTPLRIR